MNNAELIKALRCCADTNCTVCLRRVTDKCTIDRLCTDAADALEAAEKRIAELESQLPKEGKWMVYPLNDFIGRRTGNHRIVCKCGYGKTLYHNNKLPRFCENCGAKMKGEQE